MKGQLTIEYLISFVIFIGLIAYIYLSYSANIPTFLEEVRKEDVRSRAFQLSEILVNNPGEPSNWDASTVKRIGLMDQNSNKQNLISKDKIDELIFLTGFPCTANGYDEITSKLAMEKNFSIIISKIEGNGDRSPLYTCITPYPVKGAINTTITRIVALNDTGTLETAELIIQM